MNVASGRNPASRTGSNLCDMQSSCSSRVFEASKVQSSILSMLVLSWEVFPSLVHVQPNRIWLLCHAGEVLVGEVFLGRRGDWRRVPRSARVFSTETGPVPSGGSRYFGDCHCWVGRARLCAVRDRDAEPCGLTNRAAACGLADRVCTVRRCGSTTRNSSSGTG